LTYTSRDSRFSPEEVVTYIIFFENLLNHDDIPY
jgi:hypothetical protein